MRILSNDYPANLPNSEKQLKGGPARFARDFSNYALSKGHEWVGLIHDAKLRTGMEELGSAPGKRFFSVRGTHASFENVFALAEYPDLDAYFAEELAEIESVIDRTKPDLLFLNGYSIHAWLIQRAAQKKNLPVIIEHAGLLCREVEAYADLYHEAGIQLAKHAERDGAQQATINIFLNEFSKEVFEKDALQGASMEATVIPLPHAGWSFPDAYARKDREERIIGVVARWDRIKNHPGVLAFAEEAQKQGLPWRVQSVTEIPDTQKQLELKTKYREHVEVLPHMDRDAIRAFYESLDVLIVPSNFDVSPTIVMEGLARGVPSLISPNVGWVSEYRTHGMQDWIVDFADPAQAVSALAAQFARDAWPEVGALAQYVETAHAPETVFAEYLSLFERITS